MTRLMGRWTARHMLAAAALTAAALLSGPLEARAQTAPGGPAACAPHGEMTMRLKEAFGETRVGLGLGGGAPSAEGPGLATAVVELYASMQSGSWTVLVTRADGRACILAAGRDWLADAPDIALLGDPA